MKTRKLLLLSFSMLLFTLTSCTSSLEETPITFTIPSLKENYSIMLDEARKWQSDVYLNEATIHLYPDTTFAISTSFYSPSTNFESIGIYLLWDGTVETQLFQHSYPIYHHEPITPDDWEIDSQEVLAYVSDENRKFINSGKFICSFIRLERFLPEENHPVVWFLNLWDCSNSSVPVYLDPSTGATINLSRDIIPTRFPTKTPNK